MAKSKRFQPARSSPSAEIKSRLDYPVIDTDLHTNEFTPLLLEYVDKVGGAKAVDAFRGALARGFGLRGSSASDWYRQTPEERLERRTVRPPWWARPAKNTLDLATVTLPALLHERLAESGTDFAVLYPNITTFAVQIGNEELRRIAVRAVNAYNADLYAPYADRLTPVAAIPLHTPQEGIEELEYAVNTLKLKTALIPGAVRRPVKSVAAKYPFAHHPEVGQHAVWIDNLAVDSEYDYDPFWAKAVELGTPLTTHSGSQGWSGRATVNNYMYNHIGHFADASHALTKALFFGGVTRRYPKLRVGLLEGGAGWGAQLYADIVGHWEKRNGTAVQNYNPASIDLDLLERLYKDYGADQLRGRENEFTKQELVGVSYGGSAANHLEEQDPNALDDFAAAGVNSIEEIRDRFVPNFYFGSEADDPTVAYAFNTKVNPLSVELNAFWASDSGHWDVPDLTEVLAETWALVERGALTERNFQDLVFNNPYTFYTEANPNFFAGTQVEAKLNHRRAA